MHCPDSTLGRGSQFLLNFVKMTDFMTWQCRLRKRAVREEGGRPSRGMQPRVTRLDGSEILAAMTVLILEKDPTTSTHMFRHIGKQSHDPRQRYEKGLKLLAAEYLERPERFADFLTAQFTQASETAVELVQADRCVLCFREGERVYSLECRVAELRETDPFYQATCWHNDFFSQGLMPRARVLCFVPVEDPPWSDGESGRLSSTA